MKRNLLSLLVLFASRVWADVGQDYVVSRAEFQKMGSEESGHSVAPVIGYDPIFKFVFGAGYFYDSPALSFGVDVNSNFDRIYQVHGTFIHRFLPQWEYGFRTSVTKGFDAYYGQGGETRDADFSRLWGLVSWNRAYLAYKPSKIFSFGLFVEGRLRTENIGGGEGSPAGRIAPDESTMAVGVFQKIDTRDNKKLPRKGFVFGTAFSFVPSPFTTLPGSEFGQLEADFIVYEEILDEYIPDVIAAFQVMGGISFSQPSYLYDFRLGGPDRLRGYNENRFRGKKYYMQQTELRFPIWNLFSGAAFLGFGDATDDVFTNPKLAYGLGLRVGLPPDFISRIRIDFGVGRDCSGVYADFGQTF